jgi:hypothetical protein
LIEAAKGGKGLPVFRQKLAASDFAMFRSFRI